MATEPPPRITTKPPALVVVDAVGDDIDQDDQDDDFDPDSLQSVESEHVDSYYDDYLGYKHGGRWSYAIMRYFFGGFFLRG